MPLLSGSAASPPVLQDQSSRLSGGKLLLVFLGLQLALFLSFLDSTSVSTASPIIGQDLGASSTITWVGTSFLVANTSFQIVSSRLSDIFGRKVVLLGALFLFVLGDLLCGFAQSAVWLYCARAIAGIGGGGINSLSMIIVSDVVPMRDRGVAQGMLGIAISLGSGLGPFAGGLFAQKVTWRWTFWITPPMGVATMLIIWFLLPLTPVKGDFANKVRQMDWTGTILSLCMTICFLVPLSGGGSTFAWNSPIVIALFVVSGIAFATFIVVESKFAKLPLLPGRIFRNRNISLILVQTWLVGSVFYGNIFFAPLYLQNVLGYGAITSAALLLPLILTQTFTTTISGFVVKYTGRTKSSFVFGFLFWIAGQAGQLCFSRSTPIWTIVVVLFVQGIGIGATLQSTLVLAQASGVPEDRAVVTGARNFARTIGGAIALAVGDAILNNIFSKSLPSTFDPALRASLKNSFSLDGIDSQVVRDQILDAYMKGIKDVFIYFVPVIGLCFVICFLIEDLALDTEPEPAASTSITDEEKGTVIDTAPQSSSSSSTTTTLAEAVDEAKSRSCCN